MFGLEGIEIAIGLTLVYLTLATICSVIRERVEAVLRTRAVDLERGVRELLGGDASLTEALYNHPLISSLFKGSYDKGRIDPKTQLMPRRGNLPSYIPSDHFVAALLDITLKGAAAGSSGVQLRTAVTEIENPQLKRLLTSIIDTAQDDIDAVRKWVGDWFNAAMDRVSGWYKRRSQLFILMLSVAVTVAVNANTLTIIERLSIDTSLRQALVEQVKAAKAPDADNTPLKQLGQLDFPLGWSQGWPGPPANPVQPVAAEPHGWQWWWYWALQPGLGLLITALAVSLGAPVWYDIMNRLISLRAAIRPDTATSSAKVQKAAA